MHLIADTEYEIPVAARITPASASEHIKLRGMVAELLDEDPALAQRCEEFSADRGLDSAQTKAQLWDGYRIRPLIRYARVLARINNCIDHSLGFELYFIRGLAKMRTRLGLAVRCCCESFATRRRALRFAVVWRQTSKLRAQPAIGAPAENRHSANASKESELRNEARPVLDLQSVVELLDNFFHLSYPAAEVWGSRFPVPASGGKRFARMGELKEIHIN